MKEENLEEVKKSELRYESSDMHPWYILKVAQGKIIFCSIKKQNSTKIYRLSLTFELTNVNLYKFHTNIDNN